MLGRGELPEDRCRQPLHSLMEVVHEVLEEDLGGAWVDCGHRVWNQVLIPLTL